MSDALLEAIRARAEAATAGPWSSDLDIYDGDDPEIVAGVFNKPITLLAQIGTGVMGGEKGGGPDTWKQAEATQAKRDADFMAAARTDIPILLARLTAAEERAAKAQEAAALGEEKAGEMFYAAHERMQENNELRAKLKGAEDFIRTITAERDHARQVEVPHSEEKAGEMFYEATRRMLENNDLRAQLTAHQSALRACHEALGKTVDECFCDDRDGNNNPPHLPLCGRCARLVAALALSRPLVGGSEGHGEKGDRAVTVLAEYISENTRLRALIWDFYVAYCDRDVGHKDDFKHPNWKKWTTALGRFLDEAEKLDPSSPSPSEDPEGSKP